MASSSVALKKLIAINLFTKALRRPIAAAASVHSAPSRLFTTSFSSESDDDDDYRGLNGVDFYTGRPFTVGRSFSPLSDVFHPSPLSSTRSLNHILNMMDQVADSPYFSATYGLDAGARWDWDAKETEDGLYLRMDMPGLSKEDVKVTVEDNTLVIKGQGEADSDEEEDMSRYASRIHLSKKMFKISEIKAEMKNGVLKVMVPKIQEEERTDVFHVKVE